MARHRFTRCRPILPKPRINTFRPAISIAGFSHLAQVPWRTSRSKGTVRFASESKNMSACSATVTEFAVPAMAKGIPACVSAATSTES